MTLPSPAITRIRTFSKCAVVAVLLWIPFAIWGAVHCETDEAGINDWLPTQHLARVDYEDFQAKFGVDQHLIAAWPNVHLHDPRLDQFAKSLKELDHGRYFQAIETANDAYARLTSNPLQLSDEVAKERIQGILLGRDDLACAVMLVTDEGASEGELTLELLREATDLAGLRREDLKIAGTLYEETAVDQASHRALVRLAPPSTIAAIVVATLMLRSLVDGLLVLLLAGLGQLTAIAVLYYSGGQFSAVLIVLPTLVFMLCLSAAIHLINYAKSALRRDPRYVGEIALSMGFRPTVLACITTAIGMLSLVASHLVPVQQFGHLAALSLLVATTILLSVLPIAIDWLWRWKRPCTTPQAERAEGMRWHGLAERIRKQSMLIAFTGSLLLLFSFLGILRLRASTKFDSMFTSGSETLESMQWIEENIGPLVSIEVLLSFPADTTDLLQQVRWIAAIQGRLEQLPVVPTTISAVNFLPSVPAASGLQGTVSRSVFTAKLRDSLASLGEGGWIHVGSRPTWRITCRTTAFGELDYEQVARLIRNDIDATLDRNAEQPAAPRWEYATGLSLLITETQKSLLSDLGGSFVMAFAIITPIMVIATRSVVTGLLAMIPNVLPVALVFGTMGWLNIPLDIAGILTASIALGISVDDTLHFISWYNDASQRDATHHQRLCQAFQHCAVAMLQTTIVCCAAMFPFFFSDFMPTRRFAILMVCMLGGAIIGDLLLLPALLSLKARWWKRELTEALAANAPTIQNR